MICHQQRRCDEPDFFYRAVLNVAEEGGAFRILHALVPSQIRYVQGIN
jgi:hypothetical protein